MAGFKNRCNDSLATVTDEESARGLWQTSARSAGISVNTSAPITSNDLGRLEDEEMTTKP